MPVARSAAAVLAAAALLASAACGGAQPPSTAPSPSSASQTDVDALTGRATTVTLDGAFLRTLAELRVAPAAVDPAGLDDDVLTLPVTGGELTLHDPRSQSSREVLGRVEHAGGLQLTGPDDTAVRVEALELDPDQSRVYGRVVVDGAVTAERVEVLTVDGRDMLPVRPGDGAGLLVLQGSRWALSPTGAQVLADALGVGFTPGLALGVAETTVELEP